MTGRVRRLAAGLLVASLGVYCVGCSVPESEPWDETRVQSPDGQNAIYFRLVDGEPRYSVERDGRIVITESPLGFVFKGEDAPLGPFEVVTSETTSFDETWEQVWGETRFVRNRYQQLHVELRETGDAGRRVDLEFRVFDDGIAFRYLYPQQGQRDLAILDELTEFRLPSDGTAWWIGAYQDHRYEYLTTESKLSEIGQAHTPLTIETDDGLYLSFHEARLVDFASMVLERRESSGGGTTLKADLVPWADGDRVKTDGSFNSPWRTVQIAERPGDLITSYLVLNLNDPNRLTDTSWMVPHKYLGIWWGMHIGKFTFWESPAQGATTENAKEYIDACVELGIDHLLIEGWNKGWTPAWYEDGMHEFSFTDEADGFDLAAVVDYARERGVQIVGYHETGANVVNYRRQMDAGMALYESLGIHDVKIGQVGSRLNLEEWHYGQFGVRYYREVLEKASQHRLTVNFHEPIKDTGERRTFPNMMTREGARGQEYNAWSEGNPPSHTATLPFTRLLAGPMDFTPGILDVGISQGYEGRDVHTTAAKQLALYVVLYSPIQMLADLPENYRGHPGLRFLQDVPVDWQETRVLGGEIGRHVTIVRKDRHGDDWYLGSLTDESAREFDVALDFLDDGAEYEAQIYADAPGITWQNSADQIEVSSRPVTSADRLKLSLAPGGGSAVRFFKKL